MPVEPSGILGPLLKTATLDAKSSGKWQKGQADSKEVVLVR